MYVCMHAAPARPASLRTPTPLAPPTHAHPQLRPDALGLSERPAAVVEVDPGGGPGPGPGPAQLERHYPDTTSLWRIAGVARPAPAAPPPAAYVPGVLPAVGRARPCVRASARARGGPCAGAGARACAGARARPREGGSTPPPHSD